VTSSAERLQLVLRRALATLRAGDELEARRMLSEHFELIEAGERPRDPVETAGRARTGRERYP
jgi:hypothetical protein